jgi:DNA processing protein
MASRWRADLASGLVERGVGVVSGGAYGIDGAAHRDALAAEGVTVAVMAGDTLQGFPCVDELAISPAA